MASFTPESVPTTDKAYYFTPAVNLSGFKNPVVKILQTADDFSTGIDFRSVVITAGKGRYASIKWPDKSGELLPSLDGLKIGLSRKLYGSEVLTVGEMPSNREDINLTDFTKKAVKGEIKDEEGYLGLFPIVAPGGEYKEAEMSFTCDGLSALDQAYVIIGMRRGPEYCRQLTDGGGEGQFTCVALTPTGETEAIFINSYYSVYSRCNKTYCLLPANTSEIRIRWRFPLEIESLAEKDGIDSYDQTNFVRSVIQPGYRTDKTLGFDPSELTGVYNGEELAIGVPAENVSGFSANEAYDFDGDGKIEFLHYGRLYAFKDGMAGVKSTDKKLSGLGFTPGNGGDTRGYDEKTIFSVGADFSQTVIHDTENRSTRFALVDYDNDGTIEFLNLTDNTVVKIAADGTVITDRLNTMTREEYYNILPPGDNPLGSGMSVVGGGTKTPPASFASFIQADINGDGYPDFVDAASGNYYMNLGNGTFVTDSFNGTLLLRDFDGDGLNDYLFYDSSSQSVTVCLNRTDGEAVIRKLLSGYSCGNDIWCKDFDGDGDVDILIPFNAENNGGMSFLVMFENTGKGSFRKHEHLVEGAVNFRRCADWNADGKYEVLTDMTEVTVNSLTKFGRIASYAIDGLTVSSEPEYITTDYKQRNEKLTAVIDADNSGISRLLMESCIVTPANSGTNTRPERPAAPQLSFDEASGELTVTWQKGKDAQTAAADLTYELRIGTAPGLDDITGVNATADGLRRAPLAGNCGYTLMRKLNTSSWPKGNVYVSVQTVDDAGLGSEFSPSAVFEKKAPAASFIIEAPAGVAVYEEISLRPTGGVGSGIEWDLDGGELLGQTADGAKVMFRTPGEKKISMTVRAADGSEATYDRTFTVAPVRMEQWLHNSPAIAIDLDCDGKQEIYVYVSGVGERLYEGDDQGNYTRVNRLFNTQDYYPELCADINGDGYADIIHHEGHLINDGDKSMTNIVPDGFKSIGFVADLDNDGKPDARSDGRFRKNSGDYVNFIDIDTDSPEAGYLSNNTYDVDGDGFVDIMGDKCYYRNLGNFKFSKVEIEAGDNLSICRPGDFDGDGKTDHLCYDYSAESYHILWSDGSTTEIGNYRRSYYFAGQFDFDNNGCCDIFLLPENSSVTGRVALILFEKDHTFNAVEIEGDYSDVLFTLTDGNVGMGCHKVFSAPNRKPSRPGKPTAGVEGGYLVIEWEAATDAETPSAALTYNLSVSRKGAEGEGAYVISPLNGGADGALLPSDANVIRSTRFAIPLMALRSGEYDIKVQAVDSRLQTGPFSDVTTYEVEALGYEAPTEAMVGNTVAITFNADVNIASADFGEDAVVESTQGQTVYVYWTTPGVKTVRAGKVKFDILVHPGLNAWFELPERVQYLSKVRIYCDNAHNGRWYLSHVRQGWNYDDPYFEVEAESVDDSTVLLTMNTGGYQSTAHYKVKHVIEESWGTAEYETTTFVSSYSTPQVGIVDIDGETQKYCVRTTAPGPDVEYFMVYRETGELNDYEYIGTVGGNGTLVDTQSDPKTRASRYAVKNIYTYGESQLSKAHQPIHAMISGGINGEWNLSWNKYEGRDVTTYRILRGSSPESLECIAEVSGNTLSYSDYDASATTRFYAVETLIEMPAESRAATSAWRSRSNTVSTAESDISQVIGAAGRTPRHYVDATGRIHSAPVSGVNIVVYTDGTTGRIIIK